MKTQSAKHITKHTRTSRTGKIIAALVGLALLTAAGSPAFAGKGNVGKSNVMPPQSHSHGLNYAEWAKRFWVWAEPSWFRQLKHAFLPFTGTQESLSADNSMPEMIHLVNLGELLSGIRGMAVQRANCFLQPAAERDE